MSERRIFQVSRLAGWGGALLLMALVVPASAAGQRAVAEEKQEVRKEAKEAESAASQRAGVDPATGALRQPTAAEIQQAQQAEAQMLNRSAAALQPVYHANGMISMSLEGSFLNVSVATLGANGQVGMECVTDHGTLQALMNGALPSRPLPGTLSAALKRPVAAHTHTLVFEEKE